MHGESCAGGAGQEGGGDGEESPRGEARMGGGEGRRREGVAERGECGGTGHGEGREDRTGRGRMGCVCVSGRVGRSVRVGMGGCWWELVCAPTSTRIKARVRLSQAAS